MTLQNPAALDPATRVGVIGFRIDPVSRRLTLIQPTPAPVFGFPPERWADPGFHEAIIHPDDRVRVLREQGAHAATVDDSLRLRYRVLTTAGQVRWIEERRRSGTRPGEPVAGIWLEVTEEHVTDSAIDMVTSSLEGRIGEEFLRRLATTLCQALAVRAVAIGAIGGPDRDRVTTVALAVEGAIADPVTYSLTGAPCREAANGHVVSIRSGADRAHPACSVLQELRADSYVAVPVYGAAPLPIGLAIVLHDSPLPDVERVTRILEALAPRTGAELERCQAEERRIALQRQLVGAQKMEALGTLAGGIAHDFNNILMGILGNTEMALEELEQWHPASTNLTEIRRAAHRARDLVQRILTFGRKREPIRQTIFMKTVIDDAVLLLRASLPSTIELVVEHREPPRPVNADASQIHQVLMNLASNAAHAIGNRPGRITLRDSVVDLTTDGEGTQVPLPEGRYLKVAVIDTGIGMDKATMARAFEPFFTTKAPGEGTGLGLAVAHGVMQEHAGAITVASTPGQGAVFDLYFPLADGSVPADLSNQEAFPLGKGEHILLVDDEAAIVRVTSRMLQRLGYRVSAYDNAPKALADLEANPDQFDLIISDLTMPEVTGLDMAERIRRTRPAVPIVLTSGHSDLGGDGRLALVDHVLTKPYASSTLAQTVHRLVVRDVSAAHW